ncbi:MAG: hypothetical protein JG781_170 [Peptococcaceae bacterium]|nr:hypothetical protein [Peptococcaceae bacterium]
MSEILWPNLVKFIQDMVPERSGLLKELEMECQAEHIPMIQPQVGQFLLLLLSIHKPVRILEIGTAIGYSTLWFTQALQDTRGHITTIELDKDRYERACANFLRAGVAGRITPLLGDANELLPTLKGPYDFIFIDAAKGQYGEFFAKAWALLAPAGVIVMDNIFLNGWVIDMTWPHRRKKTMVVRVRDLLENITSHPDLLTSLIPLGDGLSVSIRRNAHEKS